MMKKKIKKFLKENWFSVLLFVILAISIIAVIPVKEYIEFDKTVEFAGNTYYIYKYIVDNVLLDRVETKYICPEKIVNTTCIVSSNALICERFTCLEYKGMITG